MAKALINKAFASAILASFGLGGAALAQTPYDGLSNPQTLLSPPGQGAQFVSGINVGWTESAYGYDIGNNVIRAPIPRGNATIYNSGNFAVYADLLAKLGGNLTRIFVFEGGQGLQFDDGGNVSGLDPTFISNLEDELNQLRAKGIFTILVLTDPAADEGWTNNDRIFGANATSTDGSTVTVNDWYLAGQAQTDLVYNAIGPLAQRLHNDGYDNAIFSYDLLNEWNLLGDHQDGSGNYYLSGDSSHDDSYNVMRSLVTGIIQELRSVGYAGYTDVSEIGYYSGNDTSPEGTKGLGVDFLDLHWYDSNANDLPVVSPSGIPTILGECGDNGQNTTTQASLVQQYATNAVTNGYTGFMPWFLGAYNADGNVFTFIVPEDGTGPSDEDTEPAYGTLQTFEGWLASRGVMTPSHE